jgi:hypothetical protein
MEERLHDPRLMPLPHPIRIDAAAGMAIDTRMFEHAGLTATLRPYLTDETASTEWIINNVPGMRQLALDHFGILGDAHMGSFILTLNRARLRAHGDPLLEVAPALQTMLAETDLAAELPIRFFRSPYTLVYVAFARPNPLRVSHRLSGLHECEGAYIGTYHLPPRHEVHRHSQRAGTLQLDPARPTRIIEIVITGSPAGKANVLDDASQDLVLFVQDEDEDLSAVLARHLAFFKTTAAYSHPGMAPIDAEEVERVGPVVHELAKILLYLNLADAEQSLRPERTDLKRRLGKFGTKLSAKRRARVAQAYDRIVIGPRESAPEPPPDATDPAAPHTVRPHWRRGHFRRIRFGEGHAESRLGWIRPVLVNAAVAFGSVRPRPYEVR